MTACRHARLSGWMSRYWRFEVEVEREAGRHAASVAALARGWSRTSVVGGGSGAERLRVASLAAMSVRRRGSVMRSDSTILRESEERTSLERVYSV